MPTELPPILVASRKPQIPGGIDQKPSECLGCAWSPYTKGFVGDYAGAKTKLALMFGFPSKDEVINREALTGDMGTYILRNYIYPLGYKKEELLITYVLRCQPPWSRRYQRPQYPTGRTKDKAEVACRTFDRAVIDFAPNVFLITFSPREVLKVPAYKRQLQVDMRKVRSLIEKGYRPLVLLGNEASELFAPWIVGRGSSKAWRGTFWEGEYKFSNKGNEGFISL